MEQDQIALKEDEDPILGVEMDTHLAYLIHEAEHAPTVEHPLEAEEVVHSCYALKVKQAIGVSDHDPGLGVTHNQGVGATCDLEAGIHIPEAKQGTLDLEADHMNQC